MAYNDKDKIFIVDTTSWAVKKTLHVEGVHLDACSSVR